MSPRNTFILGQKVSHKNIACVGLCTLVSAGFCILGKELGVLVAETSADAERITIFD